MNLEQALEDTIVIASEAAALLRRGFGEVKRVSIKSSSTDLVTEYDLAAEQLILAGLAERFPGHTWVAEEGGAQPNGSSRFTWYIDPLDGTNNFAHGYPVFCVSMALYEGDQPLLAVVLDPLREECFSAIAGRGAYLRIGQGAAKALQVSAAGALDQSLLATGFPYDRHTSAHDNMAQFAAFLKRAQGLRRAGSAALDLANVAAGRLDGFWEFKLSRWDVAAGILLVQEAGGLVTDMAGRPVSMIDRQVHLVAANERLHPQMLAVLEGIPVL
jgi:myo-inositol-1(or 4)-monophosphatase